MKFYAIVVVLLLSCTSDESYQRKDWTHWIDGDRDCQNTRQEILIERSKGKVLLDKRGCRAKSGVWEDYYFPETLTRAKDVDIDHLIPLKHAHRNGGASWTREKKERFANDPDNLVITNKRFNRQKGAKGIDQWLPSHKEYACKYIRDWLSVKNKYGLAITDQERNTVSISGCSI